MNKFIISYVSGPYLGKKSKIETQMRDCGWFDVFKVYTPSDLDKNFTTQFSNILSCGRGGGYWCWKPYIIRKTLHDMADGDILVYMDGGCTIHNSEPAKARLDEYINTLEQSGKGILRFLIPPFTELEYTTSHMLNYFKNNYSLDISENNLIHIMATVIIMKKTPDTITFFDEAIKIITLDPNIITDHYNQINPNPEFKDHRHDQSLLSLLCKSTNSSIIIPDDTWYEDFSMIDNIPILATRKNI